ncbi:N-acetyltransferase [Mycobacterium pseudoshottsii]|uniref:N-acetyltransferase n=3 Tax=Mycobacterium ulcerans group TaxID=2993898 RepID=A0A9N7LS11_9MYCO|nr:N-acetyltransferase [Mycobacterium pseudoshottsii]BEH77389.1 N-acetyltransferase [Mycobacterium pseudoshottsii]
MRYHWFAGDSILASSMRTNGWEYRCDATHHNCPVDSGSITIQPLAELLARGQILVLKHRTKQPRGGQPALTIFVIDLPPDEMERHLREALTVYVDAMRYPRGTENQRAAMWLEHVRRSGWKAVAAVDVPQTQPSTQLPDIIGADPNHELPAADLANAPMVGVAYGYPGAPGQWWQQQVVLGLQRRGFPMHAIARVMSSYFELTELHIHPNAQGRGIGEALTRRLLAGRGEESVLLSTPESNGEDNRAWRLYRRLGFTDILRGYYFAGDPRAFAILGRALPL